MGDEGGRREIWGIEILDHRISEEVLVANRDLVKGAIADAKKSKGLDTIKFIFIHAMFDVPISGFGTVTAVSRADSKNKKKHMDGINKLLQACVEGLKKENAQKVSQTIIENDSRKVALCEAATTLKLTRLYMTSKKKLIGKSLGKEVEHCAANLPKHCALHVFQNKVRVMGSHKPALPSSSASSPSPSTVSSPSGPSPLGSVSSSRATSPGRSSSFSNVPSIGFGPSPSVSRSESFNSLPDSGSQRGSGGGATLSRFSPNVSLPTSRDGSETCSPSPSNASSHGGSGRLPFDPQLSASSPDSSNQRHQQEHNLNPGAGSPRPGGGHGAPHLDNGGGSFGSAKSSTDPTSGPSQSSQGGEWPSEGPAVTKASDSPNQAGPQVAREAVHIVTKASDYPNQAGPPVTREAVPAAASSPARRGLMGRFGPNRVKVGRTDSTAGLGTSDAGVAASGKPSVSPGRGGSEKGAGAGKTVEKGALMAGGGEGTGGSERLGLGGGYYQGTTGPSGRMAGSFGGTGAAYSGSVGSLDEPDELSEGPEFSIDVARVPASFHGTETIVDEDDGEVAMIGRAAGTFSTTSVEGGVSPSGMRDHIEGGGAAVGSSYRGAGGSLAGSTASVSKSETSGTFSSTGTPGRFGGTDSMVGSSAGSYQGMYEPRGGVQGSFHELPGSFRESVEGLEILSDGGPMDVFFDNGIGQYEGLDGGDMTSSMWMSSEDLGPSAPPISGDMLHQVFTIQEQMSGGSFGVDEIQRIEVEAAREESRRAHEEKAAGEHERLIAIRQAKIEALRAETAEAERLLALKQAEEATLSLARFKAQYERDQRQLAERERMLQEECIRELREVEERLLEQKQKQEQERLKQVAQQRGGGGGEEHLAKYSEEELAAGCNSFAPEFVIGEGAFGTVFRATLKHLSVAIKRIDNADLADALREFNKELKVQVGLRHPDMVMLLGYCERPPYLVYELMERGSLHERLLCLGDSNPLPWPRRFNIFFQICRAIAYLHQRTPPIIHLDLKPANILLDRNWNAKVGDVGLAKFLYTTDGAKSHVSVSSVGGTDGYTDPLFLRRRLLHPSSDVYSLGQVLWDLLLGVRKDGEDGYWDRRDAAEEATEEEDVDKLVEALDPSAGDWPPAVVMKLCQLAAHCIIPDKKEKRPKMEGPKGVMETLAQLAIEVRIATGAEETEGTEWEGAAEEEVPQHFICPILKTGMMADPVMASDGHTYERSAIEGWLEEHETSPVTGEELPSLTLFPNHTLRALIVDWQSKQQQRKESVSSRISRVSHRHQRTRSGSGWSSGSSGGGGSSARSVGRPPKPLP